METELSTEESISLIDQLADAGVLILAFSGGEPLLRSDWRILVEHAVQRGLGVNVGSNGSSITEEIAEELEKLVIKSVTISLDSYRPEFHDQFRNCPGLFTKAVNAIRFLVKKNVRVVVGFTPTRLNWKEGKSVIELAYGLGADAINLSEYVPAGRGTIDLSLTPNDLETVLKEWIQYREEYKSKIDLIWHDC